MLEFFDGELSECPRCGKLTCEISGQEYFCPHCLYHEVLPMRSTLEGGSHLAAEDEALPHGGQDFVYTLGEYVERIPSNVDDWDLSLDFERNLNMNTNYNAEQTESAVKVFDVMVKEDGKNGATYWQKVGVAFPLTTSDSKL